MSKGTIVSTTVRIEASECDPGPLSIHDGDRIAILLHVGEPALHAYLVGTADELHWLCGKLRAIVTAHESVTTLAGDAAREIADRLDARPYHRCSGCNCETQDRQCDNPQCRFWRFGREFDDVVSS